MPTIARVGPYRVFFYANEGDEPRHVHVQRDFALAKYWLEPVTLCSSTGFPAHELRTVQNLIEARQRELKRAWDDFFRS